MEPSNTLLNSTLLDASSSSSLSSPLSLSSSSSSDIEVDPDYSLPNMAQVSDNQISVIVKLEAAGGSLSLVGVTLIFITFAWCKRLRTLPNTFIVFASIANVGASIACLIGHRGLDDLKLRKNEFGQNAQSPLCTTQAFLLEMFMQADPWWSFAMAFNVFLVFFFQANPDSFRKWLWLYCVVCFGGPAVAAIICAVLTWPKPGTDQVVPVYGDATLWCWIGAEANVMRIYTYYLPIWTCIVGSILIYFAVGYHVFRQRNQLKNLTLSNQEKNESADSNIRDSDDKNSGTRPDYYGTKVTEIQITTTASSSAYTNSPPPPSTITADRSAKWVPSAQCNGNEGMGSPSAGPFQSVSSVSSEKQPTETISEQLQTIWRRCVRRLTKMDTIKMAYLRTSFVFAFSVLVTWTPSSILRVHDLVSPHNFSFPLNVAAAIVLPLQGAWNAVIYFSTSWTVMREEIEMLRRKMRRRRGKSGGANGSRQGIDKNQIRIRREVNASEVELTRVVVSSNSNIRAMRGSF